jgi:hypothetical protein
MRRGVIVLLALSIIGGTALIWRIQQSYFRSDRKPAMLNSSGSVLFFSIAGRGIPYARRDVASISADLAEIRNWVNDQLGWSLDQSRPDNYPYTEILSDVYCVDILPNRILVHYALTKGDSDDDWITIGRPLSTDDKGKLDSMTKKIERRNSVVEYISPGYPTVRTRVANQLPDPTSSSVTPPAGAEGAPSVAADH